MNYTQRTPTWTAFRPPSPQAAYNPFRDPLPMPEVPLQVPQMVSSPMHHPMQYAAQTTPWNAPVPVQSTPSTTAMPAPGTSAMQMHSAMQSAVHSVMPGSASPRSPSKSPSTLPPSAWDEMFSASQARMEAAPQSKGELIDFGDAPKYTPRVAPTERAVTPADYFAQGSSNVPKRSSALVDLRDALRERVEPLPRCAFPNNEQHRRYKKAFDQMNEKIDSAREAVTEFIKKFPSS